jgi:hypothetical protein
MTEKTTFARIQEIIDLEFGGHPMKFYDSLGIGRQAFYNARREFGDDLNPKMRQWVEAYDLGLKRGENIAQKASQEAKIEKPKTQQTENQ